MPQDFYSSELRAYVRSNSALSLALGAVRPEMTSRAHSKYCRLRSTLQFAGGLERIVRRFEILSASFRVCARGDCLWAFSTWRALRISLGSDLSSVTSI